MKRAACDHCGLPARASGPPPYYCCLGCRIAAGIAGVGGEEGQARWHGARFLLGALFGMAVMTLSLIRWSDEVYQSGLDQTALGEILRWALLALTTPVLLLLGPPLLDPSRRGWARIASLDHQVLLAVTAAWGLSAWHVLRGSGELWFETAAMVLVLLTLGRWLEASLRARTARTARGLRQALPETARVLEGEGLRERPLAEVRPGQRIRVLAGEAVPLDGRVVSGRADVDLSALTGEAEPASRGPGEAVPAGSRLLDGALELVVEAGAGQRALDRIQEILEEARWRQGPALRAADRLAGVLLPATMLLALVVLVERSLAGDPGTGVVRALAVLLVSCPCALTLAAPLTTWNGVRQALARGLLVREPALFEILPRVRTFLFDKTGTLSHERRRWKETWTAPGMAAAGVREAARALAAASAHPAARALAGGPAPALPEGLEVHPGLGVAGSVGGLRLRLGSLAFCCPGGAPAAARTTLERWEEEGDGVLALAEEGGRLLALFRLGEELRPGAAELLDRLRSEGRRLRILSGDRPAAADALGRRLGVEVLGGLEPADKARIVEEERRAGPVFYLGDGINDGPALAAADASAAPGHGTEQARSQAGAILLEDDLRALQALRELAAAVRRRLRLHLAWAAAWNPPFLFLAATGRLSPILCALAMVASSLTVTALALRPAAGSRAAAAARSPREAWTSPSRPSCSAS